MTSKDILGCKSTHILEFWLREIAYQLAVANEFEAKRHEDLLGEFVEVSK